MRLVLCTTSLDVNNVLRKLFASEHTIVGVVISRKSENSSYLKKSFTFIKRTLKVLLKGVHCDMEFYLKRNKIPFFRLEKNQSELAVWLKELDVDLIVVRSMFHLLRKEVLSIPKKGCINLHPSYLPEYRGPNPMHWIYYNMDLNPGVTIHYIDIGEDTGDIIYQQRYKLSVGSSYQETRNVAMENIGIELLLKAIKDIENGIAPRKKQPLVENNFRARKIKKNEYGKLINWNEWSVERVYHYLQHPEAKFAAITQPKGHQWGFVWEIGGYKKINIINEEKLGNILKHESGYKLKCKDGYVMLKRKFRISNLINF